MTDSKVGKVFGWVERQLVPAVTLCMALALILILAHGKVVLQLIAAV